MKQNTNRLLVIDDEQQVCRLIGRVASGLGFDVREALDISHAEELLGLFEPTAIVLDLSIPGRDGASFLRDIAGRQFDSPILLISGLADSALESAELLGAQHGLNVVGSLRKPLSLPALKNALIAIGTSAQQEGHGNLASVGINGQLKTSYEPVFRIHAEQRIIAGMRVELPRLHAGENLSVQPGTEFSRCEMQLVRNITDNLLLETVSHLWQWKDVGISLFGVVALSPTLLNDPGIPGRLMALMDEFDVEPQMLMLDISCVDLGALSIEVPDVLARLRACGFPLIYEFDNLNTDAMNQALAASVTAIGIHPSILSACAANQDSLGLLQAMISLAHRAGLTVWTNGIADTIQMQTAADVQCDFVAGEYIGSRLAANQVMAYASAHGNLHRPTMQAHSM